MPDPEQVASTRWSTLGRSVLRESRAARGRLAFFTLCLAIGVAAVVGVSSLVSTIRVGLASESRDLLAADVRVQARRPLPEEVGTYFSERAHRRADLIEMGAMASLPSERVAPGAEASRLVETLEGAVALCGVGALGFLIAFAAGVVLLKELADESARRARGPVR